MTLQRHLNNLFIKSSKKIPLKISINQNQARLMFLDKNKNLQKMNRQLKKMKIKKLKMGTEMRIIRIMINKMIIMILVTEETSMTIKILTKKMMRIKKKNFFKKLLINREEKKNKDLRLKN
jgi:hypothetical protein